MLNLAPPLPTIRIFFLGGGGGFNFRGPVALNKAVTTALNKDKAVRVHRVWNPMLERENNALDIARDRPQSER